MGDWSRRAAKAGRAAEREITAIRALRPEVGIRRAVASRVRWNLELGSVRERLAALEGVQAQLISRSDTTAAQAVGAGRAARSAREEGVREATLARARLDALERIMATTAWVEALPASATLVSVIVPTRNRAQLVREAIASIQASTHQSWEAIVVDDASEDETLEVLTHIRDERVRVVTLGRHSGSAAARNAGLAAKRGRIVAYLDDDNLMGRHWLRALVWAFESHPEADVAYGAILHQQVGPEPRLHFLPWSRRQFELTNITDQSAIGHRADVEAWQDTRLEQATDWDQLLRLTDDRDPVEVPVIAVMYRKGSWGRLSHLDGAIEGLLHVQRRAIRRRPLRVLAGSAVLPLASAAGFVDELRALEQQGVRVASFAVPGTSGDRAWRRYDDLGQAAADFEADLVLLHGTSFTADLEEHLDALALPFALRTVFVDGDDPIVRGLIAHPLCVGVWSSWPLELPRLGIHMLPPIFSAYDQLPEPSRSRELVVGVPARPTQESLRCLLDAFDLLGDEAPDRVLACTTVPDAQLASKLARMVAGRRHPPDLLLDLPRETMLELLADAAAVVYVPGDAARFRPSMTVVEALCSGACVVVPDRPEFASFAGSHARRFRTAADVARHVQEICAGGPVIEAEHVANRAFAHERFAAPPVVQRFVEELLDGLDHVRERQAGWVAEPGSPPLALGLQRE